jgi:hypothetical protein
MAEVFSDRGFWYVAESEQFLERAEEIFKEYGHIEGELRVRMERFNMVKTKTHDMVQGMLQLADDSKTLFCRAVQIMALSYAMSAAMGLHPKDAIIGVHKLLEKACRETGNGFVQLQGHICIASGMTTFDEHISKGTDAICEYLDSAPHEMPKTEGKLAMLLGQVFAVLGDDQKSIKYAKLAVETLKKVPDYKTLSEADLMLAEATMSRALKRGEFRDEYPIIIKNLEQSLDLDEKCIYPHGVVRKCSTLVELESTLAIGDETGHHKTRQDHWMALLERANNDVDDEMKVNLINQCITTKQFGRAEALAREALTTFSTAKDPRRVAKCQHMIFSSMFRPFDFSSHSDSQLRKVEDIVCQAKTAVAAYKELGLGGISIGVVIEISQALEEFGQYCPSWKSALYGEALECLKLGESACQNMRKDLASWSGLEALLQKRILVEYKYHQEIYDRAQRLAGEIGDAQQLWRWAQVSKGKALSDMVASRLVSPVQCPTGLLTDDEAGNILEEEQRLIRGLQSASAFERLSIRKKLGQVRVRMEGHSALGHLLASRTGKIDLQDLGWIFESDIIKGLPGNGKAVLVDWVVMGNTIVMLTVDATLVPQMRVLDVSLEQVRRWKQTYLDVEWPFNGATELGNMSETGGLVSGLEKVSSKDDFLVLCPSKLLHAVPLHALKVGGISLIDRNFIIYSTSLSLLRQCCERANSKTGETQRNLRTAFFAVYEEESQNEEDRVERQEIYACATKLAAWFESDPILGADANKRNFRERAREADILHYHGHMDYKKNDVLERSLVLSDGDTSHASPGTGGQPQHQHNDNFTVRDAYSLRLDTSLASIIACKSGGQDIAAGDEPLGLLSALQYAGCATTIGTLWSVDSSDGRDLAVAFFQRLCRQRNKNESPLNLAVCFCQAVRRLKNRETDDLYLPYHWAAFAMHGAWYL